MARQGSGSRAASPLNGVPSQTAKPVLTSDAEHSNDGDVNSGRQQEAPHAIASTSTSNGTTRGGGGGEQATGGDKQCTPTEHTPPQSNSPTVSAVTEDLGKLGLDGGTNTDPTKESGDVAEAEEAEEQRRRGRDNETQPIEGQTNNEGEGEGQGSDSVGKSKGEGAPAVTKSARVNTPRKALSSSFTSTSTSRPSGPGATTTGTTSPPSSTSTSRTPQVQRKVSTPTPNNPLGRSTNIGASSQRITSPTAASAAKARATINSTPPTNSSRRATTAAAADSPSTTTSAASPSTSRLLRPTASSATKARGPSATASSAQPSSAAGSPSLVASGSSRRPVTAAPTSSPSPSARARKVISPGTPSSAARSPTTSSSLRASTSAASASRSTKTAPRPSSVTPVAGGKTPSASINSTRSAAPPTSPSPSSTLSRLMRPTASSAAHARAPPSSSPKTANPSASAAIPTRSPSTAPGGSMGRTSLSKSTAGKSSPASSSSQRIAKVRPSAMTMADRMQATRKDNLGPELGGFQPKIGVVVGANGKRSDALPAPHMKGATAGHTDKHPTTTTPSNGTEDQSGAEGQAGQTNRPSDGGPSDDIPEIPTPEDHQAATDGAAQTGQHSGASAGNATTDRSADTDNKTVDDAAGRVNDASTEKVFIGFGPNRPLGKIGVKVPSDDDEQPAFVQTSTEADAPLSAGEDTSHGGSDAPQSQQTANLVAEGEKDFVGIWGTRDGAGLPSPGLMSDPRMRTSQGTPSQPGTALASALTPDGSDGSGTVKKVPIWMRKGGE